MYTLVSLWGHAASAILFGALAMWSIGRRPLDRASLTLAIATGATALWAFAGAAGAPGTIEAQICESLRNAAWLFYMYSLWRSGAGQQRAATLVALYGVMGFVIACEVIVTVLTSQLAGSPRLLHATLYVEFVLDIMLGVGALLLVHNVYTAATPESRTSIRLPMIGMGVMWAYDLNLFTISYLSGALNPELLAMRGFALALVAPVFALSLYQGGSAQVRLSRSATFQSLGLVAIGGYLTVMVIVSSVLEAVAGEHARLAQVGFVFGTSIITLLLLPSARFRAWFRVKVAKHLFQHRYDYRAEWLRFTDTIGRPSTDAAPIETRVVQAIADITESRSGLLLVPDESGALIVQARWNWLDVDAPTHAISADSARYFQETGRIIELDTLRATSAPNNAEASAVPEWLIAEPRAWAIVPMLHFGKLAGLIILDRPTIDRMLDWEDFDLLKVVGRQVASYIAEARGQETLAHVQQFDEFNRRFAFIMHDIKNLISQLSLVTRNAEKHADNPEFQRDMIATLKNSTARMNELLARLSQHNKVQAEAPKPLEIGPLIERVAASKRITHPIVIGGSLDVYAVADAARFEQALSHIVQNAIDASPDNEPVSISVRRLRDDVVTDIEDKGAGMTSHFIRHNLFKPFSSTKDGGFGIGAYEARELISAMGGELEVNSREGQGTRFRIILPLAREALAQPMIEQALVA
jgi:putative PEP-CTERM system histidine kinase